MDIFKWVDNVVNSSSSVSAPNVPKVLTDLKDVIVDKVEDTVINIIKKPPIRKRIVQVALKLFRKMFSRFGCSCMARENATGIGCECACGRKK
jgi:Mor family transcriptional regulator